MHLNRSVTKMQELRPGGAFDPSRGVASPGGASSLPCLYSNNGIQLSKPKSFSKRNLETIQALCGILSPYYRKSAHTLFSNVSRLISQAPSIGHVGFLTLTFADNVTDAAEARERFRSFNSNYLSNSENFTHWISVKERQSRGAWHYHLLVILKNDIRTGCNLEQFENRNYSSAPSALRSLWKELRETLPAYGLGRSELLPIRSNQEAMARYLGKYISKAIGSRQDEDKGVRLVSYSKGWVKNSVNFAWYTENSILWRRKLALFAQYHGCTELYQLTGKLGPGWAYNYVNDIVDIEAILEDAGGICSKPYQDETITRTKKKKEAYKKEKQFFKDQEKFRQWEKNQNYKKAKKAQKQQARNLVAIAKNEFVTRLKTDLELIEKDALFRLEIEAKKFNRPPWVDPPF